MNEQYPHYARWLEALVRRDQGAMLIALIAVFVVALLVEGRFMWPRIMPAIRLGLATTFFLSSTIAVLILVSYLIRSGL